MITSAKYTVDGVPIKIVASDIGHRVAMIHNQGSHPMYVNGANTVSEATGFYVDKACGIVYVNVAPDEELWALCAGGNTVIVTVLLTDE